MLDILLPYPAFKEALLPVWEVLRATAVLPAVMGPPLPTGPLAACSSPW